VGIGLSLFYKRMTNSEIINAIVFQNHLLELNDLHCLKAIIPTEDERQRLALFTGDVKSLIPSEQFMVEMLRVPNAEWMLDALIFERQFSTECDSIANRISLMTAVLVKIRESPGIKALFRLVLELGNLANYDYGRVPAHMRIRGKALGFTMDSLLKLHEVKSVDRKSSLMNYLLMVVTERENHADLLSLPADFSDLATIKHWDSSGLLGELDTLQSTLKRIVGLKTELGAKDAGLIEAFREGQTAFVALTKSRLERLAILANGLRQAWTECAGYLGEDPQDKRPEELLIVFDQFFRQFKEAHQQNLDAIKAASRSASQMSLRRSASNASTTSLRSSNIPSRTPSPSMQSDVVESATDASLSSL